MIARASRSRERRSGVGRALPRGLGSSTVSSATCQDAMEISVSLTKTKGHGDIASGLGWSASNELFSCGDDHAVCRWSSEGDLEGKVS